MSITSQLKELKVKKECALPSGHGWSHRSRVKSGPGGSGSHVAAKNKRATQGSAKDRGESRRGLRLEPACSTPASTRGSHTQAAGFP